MSEHRERREIARYLLSRGFEEPLDPSTGPAPDRAAMAAAPLAFPAGLAPRPEPLDPAPSPSDPLPRADVVVVTWTVDELDALAEVLSPGVRPRRWYRYANRFDAFAPLIRGGAPAKMSGRLGSYVPIRVGDLAVLLVKSELHLNQDGIATGPGTATLPVRDLFGQVIAQTRARHVLTVGTAGSVTEGFGLGDVVVTRGARFRLTQEFRAEPFSDATYTSDWEIPTTYFETAQRLMRGFEDQLAQPPVGPPTKSYDFTGPFATPPTAPPTIRLDGRDMPAFHPILSTDYFEFGTSTNRLDRYGSGIEMGDAVLGLACQDLDAPPRWAVVRNMSNPVINGDLPTDEFPLNEQTMWAVAYYAAYGRTGSIMSALVTWAILAGLASSP